MPTSKGAPGQDVFPVVASSEIVVGENRLQIGLIDTNDAPIRSPKTTLQVGFIHFFNRHLGVKLFMRRAGFRE